MYRNLAEFPAQHKQPLCTFIVRRLKEGEAESGNYSGCFAFEMEHGDLSLNKISDCVVVLV